MSKNKSNILARAAGGHKVFQPESIKTLTGPELERHVEFIFRVTGTRLINKAINSFSNILDKFETDSQVVDVVSERLGLGKREAIKELYFYRSQYRDEVEIALLLSKEW